MFGVCSISRSWIDVLIFYVLLLWVMYATDWLMGFRDGSDSECAPNFVKTSEKVRRRPSQWLDKSLENKAWAVYGKSKLTETEKDETGEQQSQEHAHNFLWYQGYCWIAIVFLEKDANFMDHIYWSRVLKIPFRAKNNSFIQQQHSIGNGWRRCIPLQQLFTECFSTFVIQGRLEMLHVRRKNTWPYSHPHYRSLGNLLTSGQPPSTSTRAGVSKLF
jgi:hypothetical protein